jgi:hypothetical protein
MRNAKSILMFVTAALLLAGGALSSASAAGISLRGMLRGGAIPVHPSVEDLDYEGYADDFSTGFFGLAGQLMVTLGAVNVGVEAGYQGLWSAEFTLDQGFDRGSVWDEDRSDVYILGILELAGMQPIILQGGAGVHVVFWEDTYEFRGNFSSQYSEDNGVLIGGGVMGGAGVNIPVSENIGFIIMGRIDAIAYEEGFMLPVSANAGLSLTL